MAPPAELLQRKQEEFGHIWADPTDGRTEEQIAQALGVTPTVIRGWRLDVAFMARVEQRFRANLRGDLVSVWRSLRRSADAGSLGAQRLLLESLGVIEGKGTINLNVGTGSGNPAVNMNNAELDQNIHRLILETSAPDGLEWQDGKLLPANYEVMDDTETLEVASSDASGRADGTGEAGETLRLVAGEATPAG